MARNTVDKERDYRALELTRRGFTQRQIAAELGWSSHVSVAHAVQRALKELTQVDAPQTLKLMRDRLDEYRRHAFRVLATKHYVVSSLGKIVRQPDGSPLLDDGPVLQALDRLLRYDIEERRMLGIDAPTKHSVQVITESDVDAAIRQLSQDIAKAQAEGVDLAALEAGNGGSATG